MRRSCVATNEKRRSMRSGTRLTLAAILLLALAACEGSSFEPLPATHLSLAGSVTSEVDGTPIQGATVEFYGIMLSYSPPTWTDRKTTHGTTVTDADGRYAITVSFLCELMGDPIEYREYLSATAPGFDGAGYGGYGKFRCTTDTQTHDFVLSPQP